MLEMLIIMGEEKVSLAVNPLRPVTRGGYFCDNKFDVSHLEEMLEDSQIYGFIIMDGNGCLFGRVQGAKKTVLGSKRVEMPKKHKKGGQSAPRFQRLRLESREAYIKMTCEMATSRLIEGDKPNVGAIIIAGSSDFKNHLATSESFDPRLSPLILKVVDISYGGQSGFEQAIEAVKSDLSNLPLFKEKQVVADFFEQIKLSSDNETSKVVIGRDETLAALEAGVVETILLDENSLVYYKPNQDGSPPILLTEYLADHYTEIGCHVHYISGHCGEGAQFIKGFGGIGAILKYRWKYYPPESEMEMTTSPPTAVADADAAGAGAGAGATIERIEELDLNDFFM